VESPPLIMLLLRWRIWPLNRPGLREYLLARMNVRIASYTITLRYPSSLTCRQSLDKTDIIYDLCLRSVIMREDLLAWPHHLLSYHVIANVFVNEMAPK